MSSQPTFQDVNSESALSTKPKEFRRVSGGLEPSGIGTLITLPGCGEIIIVAPDQETLRINLAALGLGESFDPHLCCPISRIIS